MFYQTADHFNCVIILVCAFGSIASKETVDKNTDYKILKKLFDECSSKNDKNLCLIDKAALMVRNTNDLEIPVFGGMSFVRDKDYVESKSAKKDGLNGLFDTISKFFDSHTLVLDLTSNDIGTGRDGENKKQISRKKGKKGRNYFRYAAMLLLGTLGVSLPAIMKILTAVAAHALIASKLGLIIVGSIAVYKLFEKDHEPNVKVHTHTIRDHSEEEYDRRLNSSMYKFLQTL